MGHVTEALRSRRLELGLSQRGLAAATGLPQPVIAAYESGAREPGIANAERLAAGLGVTLGFQTIVDVEGVVAEHRDWRRAELLSLVLAHQIVIELIARHGDVVRLAHERLEVMRRQHRLAVSWFDEWDRLLSGPLHELVGALLDPSSDATDLRQSAPFAGVIDQPTRTVILGRLHAAQREFRHAS